MEKVLKKTREMDGKANILRVCFEKFVLDPEPYMKELFNFLELNPGPATEMKLKTSNVPREKSFARS